MHCLQQYDTEDTIASQFRWILFYYFLWDASLIPIRGNPCLKLGGPSLAAFGWWRTVWASILTVYGTMSGMHAIASIYSRRYRTV